MTLTISKKSASLTMKHVEMSDSGLYLCKLKNSVSDVSLEFKLTVRGKSRRKDVFQDLIKFHYSSNSSLFLK
jgi:hypothetical protein